jgi:3D-(3,5/4)-trihydroxycyclohexane-1,2-dione acylhydrolase (decyclizing)
VHVETDPLRPGPDGEAWWDVPVAEVSGLDTVREARARYDKDKQAQRDYL